MLIDINSLPIFIISIDKGGERFKALYSDLERLGIAENIQTVGGVLTDLGPESGCALSHKMMIERALSTCSTPFIVFEDDARVIDQNFRPQITVPDDAGAVYIGFSSSRYEIEVEKWNIEVPDEYPFTLKTDRPYAELIDGSEKIYKIYGVLATHAVVHTSRSAAEKLAQSVTTTTKRRGLNQDMGWAKLQIEISMYAPELPFFCQIDNKPEKEWVQSLTTRGIYERTTYDS